MYYYDENMKGAIRGYLEENCKDLDQDHWFEELEMSDQVTGNASGSYFCNRAFAKRCVLDNIDLLQEVCESLDDSMKLQMVYYFVSDDWESLDVMIRLYVFPQVFPSVWEEWEEHFKRMEEFLNED